MGFDTIEINLVSFIIALDLGTKENLENSFELKVILKKKFWIEKNKIKKNSTNSLFKKVM